MKMIDISAGVGSFASAREPDAEPLPADLQNLTGSQVKSLKRDLDRKERALSEELGDIQRVLPAKRAALDEAWAKLRRLEAEDTAATQAEATGRLSGTSSKRDLQKVQRDIGAAREELDKAKHVAEIARNASSTSFALL
jgi:hypothetical protein